MRMAVLQNPPSRFHDCCNKGSRFPGHFGDTCGLWGPPRMVGVPLNQPKNVTVGPSIGSKGISIGRLGNFHFPGSLSGKGSGSGLSGLYRALTMGKPQAPAVLLTLCPVRPTAGEFNPRLLGVCVCVKGQPGQQVLSDSISVSSGAPTRKN